MTVIASPTKAVLYMTLIPQSRNWKYQATLLNEAEMELIFGTDDINSSWVAAGNAAGPHFVTWEYDDFYWQTATDSLELCPNSSNVSSNSSPVCQVVVRKMVDIPDKIWFSTFIALELIISNSTAVAVYVNAQVCFFAIDDNSDIERIDTVCKSKPSCAVV